jgi:hypothetical protein
VSGDLTSVVVGKAFSRATTSSIAARNAGSLTVNWPFRAWMSTSSLARWLKPASARIRSA